MVFLDQLIQLVCLYSIVVPYYHHHQCQTSLHIWVMLSQHVMAAMFQTLAVLFCSAMHRTKRKRKRHHSPLFCTVKSSSSSSSSSSPLSSSSSPLSPPSPATSNKLLQVIELFVSLFNSVLLLLSCSVCRLCCHRRPNDHHRLSQSLLPGVKSRPLSTVWGQFLPIWLLCCGISSASVVFDPLGQFPVTHLTPRMSLVESAPLSSMSGSTSGNCPSVCSCIWKSGKQTATCDHRSLLAVPQGLSTTTQVIDLSGNSLNTLPPNVFMDRGLVNLQRIFLVDCQLVEISAECFVKLSNLIELDMSNNSLTVVPSKSFAECAGLRRLSLAGNRLREIRSGAFLSLARLNTLDLSFNLIVHLDTDAFRGLRSLQTLKLNSNQLQTLSAAESFVQFLPIKLASLVIHDNRWRCDCHLKPLREWITANNVPLAVKPVCSTPARLQGFQWDSIVPYEFSCPPQIHTVNTHFYKHIGNNVTIICPVTGYPQPIIYWLFETIPMMDQMKDRLENSLMAESETTSMSMQLDSDNNSTPAVLTTSASMFDTRADLSNLEQLLPSARYSISQETENHVLTSVLTVHSLEPLDTQRITCYARNVGGVAGKNFTLIVSTQEPFSSSRSMDFIVTEMFVIFFSIAILLLALVVFFTVFIARYKKRTSNHVVHSVDAHTAQHLNHQQQSHHQYQHPHLSTNGQLNVISSLANNEAVFVADKSMLISGADLVPVSNGIHLLDSMSKQVSMPTQAPSSNTNGYANAASSVVMVNSIEMIQNAIDMQRHAASLQAVQANFASDPNSADLSSQSTTATSMTLNSVNGGSSSPNGANMMNGAGITLNNSTSSSDMANVYYDQGNSSSVDVGMISSTPSNTTQPFIAYGSEQPQYPPAYATLQRQHGPNYGSIASQAPDLLHTNPMPSMSTAYSYLPTQPSHCVTTQSSNAVTSDSLGARVNFCDFQSTAPDSHSRSFAAYPLLNTGQLIDCTGANGELIYGTRIAPTRIQQCGYNTLTPHSTKPFSRSTSNGHFDTGVSGQQGSTKTNKVKFADEVETSDEIGHDYQTNRAVYTYATLGRKRMPDQSDGKVNKSISGQHRTVSSYPDGFRSLLVESSVDSGQPVSGSQCDPSSTQTQQKPNRQDSLDETEEDDYYRHKLGQNDQQATETE